MLEGLPQEILIHIVSHLVDYDHALNDLLTTLTCTCHAWHHSVLFAKDKIQFWTAMRRLHGLDDDNSRNNINQERRSKKRRRTTRHGSDMVRAFWQRKYQMDQIRRHNADELVWSIWKRLRKNDCVGWLQKQMLPKQKQQRQSLLPYYFDNNPFQSTLLYHRVAGLEHQTLFMLACWCGRPKTVQWLLEQEKEEVAAKSSSVRRRLPQADTTTTAAAATTTATTSSSILFMADDENASPLLIAAWAGHDQVIRLLLRYLELEAVPLDEKLQYLRLEGIPPLTSSCGGKGPKTALNWARRKGFSTIVRMLETAELRWNKTGINSVLK